MYLKQLFANLKSYLHYMFLVKQVFSDMDFIGWYTTGAEPDSNDIKIHKQICEINESPVMLKLNPYDKNIEVKLKCLAVLTILN